MCSRIGLDLTAIFTHQLIGSLDEVVIKQLGLVPVVDCQLRKCLRRADGSGECGDFSLTLAGKELQQWVEHADSICEAITQSSKSWKRLQLDKCRVRTKEGRSTLTSIAFFIDRAAAMPVLMRDQLSKLNESEAKCNEHVLIVSAHLRSMGSKNLRQKYTSQTIGNARRKWRRQQVCYETIRGDIRDWTAIKQLFLEAEAIEVPSQNNSSDRTGILLDVSSASNSVKPKLANGQIYLERDSETISFAVQLRSLISQLPSDANLAEVIVVVEQSGLVKVQKAGAVIFALGYCKQPITIVPLGTLNDEKDLIEHSEWLKNYIVTMSYAEEDEKASDLFKIADVSTAKVYDLHETCLRFVLMSCGLNSGFKLDKSRHREALFVQYNCARLAALLDKFDQDRSSDIEPNYALLTLDTEWQMFFNYVITFDSIGSDVCDKFATHKLVTFLGWLSRDLSIYYSKVRVLIDERQPQANELVGARVNLLRLVRKTLADGLQVLGVNPVVRM